MAITDSTLENGCLHIPPGSHKGPLLPHTASVENPPDLGIEGVDVQRAIPVEMKSGALLIHPQVIHGSEKCLSKNSRIALLWSYQAPKPAYNEFWGKAGIRFLRRGEMDWGPLEISPSK